MNKIKNKREKIRSDSLNELKRAHEQRTNVRICKALGYENGV